MTDEETKAKIIAAINSSKLQWRTPRGIAKSSGIDVEKVMEHLSSGEAFVQARNTNSKGEPLFTTEKKYRENAGLKTRVLSAITNKVVR
jgi:hypothetical protein